MRHSALGSHLRGVRTSVAGKNRCASTRRLRVFPRLVPCATFAPPLRLADTISASQPQAPDFVRDLAQ